MQVVVLTSLSGRDDVVSALDAGATGYLLKDATIEHLVDVSAPRRATNHP
jgi:DNA-binding NarL/FixJ family response regulator